MTFSLSLPELHAEHLRTTSWSPQHRLYKRKQRTSPNLISCVIQHLNLRNSDSYLAWWFGSSSCCTRPPPAASHGETRGPWSFLDSKVYAWVPQTSGRAGTWCRPAACGFPGSSPLPESSSAAVGHWRRPERQLEGVSESDNFKWHGQVSKRKWFHSRSYLQHHVCVVVGLDVIEADDSRQVGGPIVGSIQFALFI